MHGDNGEIELVVDGIERGESPPHLRTAEDIREVRDRDLRVEFRRVAVPMIGLQTRLVVVDPHRC